VDINSSLTNGCALDDVTTLQVSAYVGNGLVGVRVQSTMCDFLQNFTPEDAIEFHAFATPLEALPCV
jgi:hypothetical protein